jgi:hypothetical protein
VGDDEIEELAQDAVLIEALHLGERALDSLSDRFALPSCVRRG